MTRPTMLSGAAAGFTITLTEAARHLSMTPDTVCDLVRAGCVGAYVAAAHETIERPPLRFDEPSLAALLAALDSGADATPQARQITEIHSVAVALRSLLAANTPTDNARVAIETNRPMLSPGKDGVLYAHVRSDQVSELARRDAGPSLQVRLALTTTVPAALTRLGCKEVRGIRPAGEDKKSWRSWWRVPLSMWSLTEEDMLRVDDFPVFGGIRDGES